MTLDLAFDPEIRLTDGTVIRSRQDAIAFAREQLVRSARGEGREILDILESAIRPEEIEAAAQQFRSWVARLKLVDTRDA